MVQSTDPREGPWPGVSVLTLHLPLALGPLFFFICRLEEIITSFLMRMTICRYLVNTVLVLSTQLMVGVVICVTVRVS